jgi:DNA-binding NarL/FixJ family response regulator
VRQIKGEGNYYLSRDITSNAIALLSRFVQEKNGSPSLALSPAEPAASLSISKVEMRVARLIGEGLSNREIAETLKLKEGTVRNYVSFIMQKTGLKHRTQIAIYAFNNGFTDRNDAVKRDKREIRRLTQLPAALCRPAAQTAQAT